jgi:hypothetical protein
MTTESNEPTPGPWECGGEARIALTFDREANVFPPDAEKTGGYQYGGPVAVVSVSDDAGGLANAHLISAAPDLLAACEAALRYDEAIRRHASKGQSWVDGDDLDALYEDWIDKSRAAVARARGETPSST